MTNREAIEAMLPLEIPGDLIEKVFLEHDITGTSTYAKDNKEELDMAYVDLLKYSLTQPEFSEGGLNVKMNRSVIKNEINRVREEYGIETTGGSKIRNATNRW